MQEVAISEEACLESNVKKAASLLRVLWFALRSTLLRREGAKQKRAARLRQKRLAVKCGGAMSISIDDIFPAESWADGDANSVEFAGREGDATGWTRRRATGACKGPGITTRPHPSCGSRKPAGTVPATKLQSCRSDAELESQNFPI